MEIGTSLRSPLSGLERPGPFTNLLSSLAGRHFCVWVHLQCVISHVQPFATPWTAARQAHLSMAFPRQEYWNGLPFPTPSDLLNSRIKPTALDSPALTGGFFTNCATREALSSLDGRHFCLWLHSGEDKTRESRACTPDMPVVTPVLGRRRCLTERIPHSPWWLCLK